MKRRNAITKLITLTMAVAAMAVLGSIGTSGRAGATARAAAQTNLTQIGLASAPIGFVPEQTLRISAVNLNPTATVSGQVKVFDAHGNVLAQSAEVELPPGQFRSFDFPRGALAAAGEPGTGRLQVRAEIIYRFSASLEQISPDNFLASMEGFDSRTGKTTMSSFLAFQF